MTDLASVYIRLFAVGCWITKAERINLSFLRTYLSWEWPIRTRAKGIFWNFANKKSTLWLGFQGFSAQRLGEGGGWSQCCCEQQSNAIRTSTSSYRQGLQHQRVSNVRVSVVASQSIDPRTVSRPFYFYLFIFVAQNEWHSDEWKCLVTDWFGYGTLLFAERRK